MNGGKSKLISRNPRRRLNAKCFLALSLWVLFGVSLSFLLYFHGQKITYFLRPVWDTPARPFDVQPHFYAPNISISRRCELHSWKVRAKPRRVFDAVLFSNELDLLDIRFHELQHQVHKFVIVESDHTFTGRKKPYFFAENHERFDFVKDKITNGRIEGRELLAGENPFNLEKIQRDEMNRFLAESGIASGDLLIMSDADEIPSAHTVELLRWCDGWQSPVHLQLRNFLYSFEFPVDYSSWRASVHIFSKENSGYGHFRRTNFMLAESGWHCSFCFRHLEDFPFKMMAYSHADRVRFASFLNPARIQSLYCEGRNLLDMLPEEFTFRDMISKMGPVPKSSSAVNLPAYLVEHADQFRFLLPGGCVRESGCRHLTATVNRRIDRQKPLRSLSLPRRTSRFAEI